MRDAPLSDRGLEQAAKWSWLWPSLEPDSVLTSPLRRAQQTAAEAGAQSPQVVPDLSEWNLGDLEGLNAEQYRANNPDWNLFRDGPPPPGESVGSVAKRARNFISGYLLGRRAPRVVAFAHGQIIKVITMVLLQQEISHASSYKIGPGRAAWLTQDTHGDFKLAVWNCSPNEISSSKARELM